MSVKSSALVNLLILQCLSILCSSQDFDFIYFVQQWPASSCDTKHGCCYPTTGKPAEDFSIHGLWPNYNTGKWPSNCDRHSSLNKTEIADLIVRMQKDWLTLACPTADEIKLWNHEWKKHGTCTTLDQHTYFQAALGLKDKANLLKLLTNAGIRPGDFYTLESISQAMEQGIGYAPGIQCNTDVLENQQLFQVFLCVDTSATNFIQCPLVPTGRCNNNGSRIEFPSFYNETEIALCTLVKV